MMLDEQVSNAITGAVVAANQSHSVGSQLIAWFEGLVEGNDSLDDRDSVDQHLELLYGSVDPGDVEEGQG